MSTAGGDGSREGGREGGLGWVNWAAVVMLDAWTHRCPRLSGIDFLTEVSLESQGIWLVGKLLY